MTGKRLFIWIAAAAVVAGAAVFFAMKRDGATAVVEEPSGKDGATKSQRVGSKTQVKSGKGSGSGAHPIAPKKKKIRRPGDTPQMYESWLSDREKHALADIRNALDDEELDGILAAGAVASASRVAEFRREYVEALAWFDGIEVMSALMTFIADPNEEVSDAAFSHWQMGLSGIDDDQTKGEIIEAAMLTVEEPDKLESLTIELNSMDETEALSVLVNVIENGSPDAVKAAKEAYEAITDAEYTTIEAAEDYLRRDMDDDATEPADEEAPAEDILQ